MGPLSPLYVHGDADGELIRLLSTHPSMDERVECLLERADRRDDPDGARRVPVR